MWDRRAYVLNKHDGDSFWVVIDQGYGDTKQYEVRLFNVFAPELVQLGGPETRDFVNAWLDARAAETTSKWKFIVTSVRMKVADREQMTLGRYVSIITSLDGSKNLNVDAQAFVVANGYPGGIGG